MAQCPRLRAVGEGYRFRHRDLGLDINMHQKRPRQPHKGSSLASTQARLGRLVVHLGHTALRDRVDLVHRVETRGQQEVKEEAKEERKQEGGDGTAEGRGGLGLGLGLWLGLGLGLGLALPVLRHMRVMKLPGFPGGRPSSHSS